MLPFIEPLHIMTPLLQGLTHRLSPSAFSEDGMFHVLRFIFFREAIFVPLKESPYVIAMSYPNQPRHAYRCPL